MNRTLLFVLAVASFVTGTTGFVLGSRYLERFRQSDAISGNSGSVSVVDREYQRVPADVQAPWMTDFTLIERSGKPVRWSDLQGKVAVTSFFFSSCPATCLQQNQKVGEIQRSFAKENVVFLSITCDPDIDSPERLREYAAKLDADPKQWLFLTGDLTYIRRVAGELFSVALDKQTHSERLIVTDKWGNVRGNFLWNKLDQVTQLKVLVKELLAETEEPKELREKKAAAAIAAASLEAVDKPATPAAATDSEQGKTDEAAHPSAEIPADAADTAPAPQQP